MTEHDASSSGMTKLSRRTLLAGAALGAAATAFATTGADAAPAPGTFPEAAPAPQQAGLPGSQKGVGFVLSHEQFAVPDLVRYGVAAEQAGFDTLWTSDHIQPWQANEGHEGFAWITLAAIGQQTKTIRFGTGVTCPTYRYRPATVAQAFRTLAQLYPGRVFLGVGSGEALNEQTATGEWGRWSERNQRLIEAVEITRQLWSGKTVNYTGKHFVVENMRFYDTPPQPVPIHIAANGPKAMYRAGKYGDGLITDMKMLTNMQAMDNFRRGATEAGKNPADIPILHESFVCVGDEAEARQVGELWRFQPNAWMPYVNIPDPVRIQQRADAEVPIDKAIQDWTISTDPQKHVDAINKLFGMGVRQVYIHSAQPDQMKVIQFYGNEVLPRLRGQK